MSQPASIAVPEAGPKSPAAMAQAINASIRALLTSHIGPVEPAYRETGMVWVKNDVSPWEYRFFDGAQWIRLGAIDPTTHTFQPAAAPSFREVTADITLTPADAGSILRFITDYLKGPVTVTLYDPRKGGAGQHILCNASQYPVTVKSPAAWIWRGKGGAPDYILQPGACALIAGAATGPGDWFVIEAGGGSDPDLRAGSFKKFVYIAANNTTLDASHFGCFVSVGIPGSDPLVINLPSAASFGKALEGGTIELENLRDDRDLTVRTPEGDFVYYPPAGLDRDNKGHWPRDLALGPRQTVRMLARGSKEWNPVGGSWRAAQMLPKVARTVSYNDLTDKPKLIKSYYDLTDSPDISGMKQAKTVRLGELKSVNVGDASMTNQELSAGSIITGITTAVQGLKHGAFTYPNGFYYRELQQADKEGNWYVVKTL